MNQEKGIKIALVIAAIVIVAVVIIMRAPRITKPTVDTSESTNTSPAVNDQTDVTSDMPSNSNEPETATNQPTETNTTMEKLGIETVKAGTGPAAQNGNTVTVHYTGTLTDGTKFDSSRDSGTPFSFTLGQGRVIQGWELGVLGMKVGEQRKLTIPSDLGYGDGGYGPIPPKATLLFDIELLSIK